MWGGGCGCECCEVGVGVMGVGVVRWGVGAVRWVGVVWWVWCGGCGRWVLVWAGGCWCVIPCQITLVYNTAPSQI